jgi:hypothetical protein
MRTRLRSLIPTTRMNTTGSGSSSTSSYTQRFPIRNSQGAAGFGRIGFRFLVSTAGWCVSCLSTVFKTVLCWRALRARKCSSASESIPCGRAMVSAAFIHRSMCKARLPNGAADKRAPDSQGWPGPQGWPGRDQRAQQSGIPRRGRSLHSRLGGAVRWLAANEHPPRNDTRFSGEGHTTINL